MLFYIDHYVDDVFFSRSEPFFDRESCVNFCNNLYLKSNNNFSVDYRISVSMSINDYDMLILKTNKTKVQFLDNPVLNIDTNEEQSSTTPKSKTKTKPPSVWRHKTGYSMKNNRKTRSFLESELLTNYFSLNEEKNEYFISDNKIELYNLDFLKKVNIKIGKQLVSGDVVNKL